MNPKSATRAAIYARQSVSDADGIERQIETCQQTAAAKDYVVVEVYQDNAVSGYKTRGEGTAFDRMLSDARAGRFDVLIVRKIDRLSRSLAAIEALTAARVAVVTVEGGIDLTTVNGRLMANLLTSVSRAESEVKAERRVFANADRRTKGQPTSGRVPYGYRWVTTKERAERGTTQAYELDGDRADDVRVIYDSFLAGVALGTIGRELTAAGKRTTSGAPFRPSTLGRILRSPYYAARLPIPPVGGWPSGYDQRAIKLADTQEGDWPAIVTTAEWEAASARLAHPERKTSPGPTRKWLLSGLALCGVCREPIRAGGGEAGIHSYRCRGMAHFMRRGDPLDSYVERSLIAWLSRADVRSKLAALLVSQDRPDEGAVLADLASLDTKVRELGDDYDAGLVDRPEYLRRLKTLRGRIDAKRAELATAATTDESLAELLTADDVEATWRGMRLDEQRHVLEVLATVVVHSVGQGNRRNMPDAAMAKTVDIVWHYEVDAEALAG